MIEKRGQLARIASRKALHIRRSAGLKPWEAVCVFDLAERLGIEVRFLDIPSMEAVYLLGEHPTIVLSSLRPPGRQAFSCAHELGHHAFGHGEQFHEAVEDQIVEKGGLAFCRALETVKPPGRQQIADFLAEKYKVDFWRDLNNISSMHNFLEWAGICKNYRLIREKFEEVAGVDITTVKKAEELSPEANVLLQALARAGGESAPGELRKQAEVLSGRRINPHSMPMYGKELEKRGFIDLPGHRGSKTAPWRIKEKKRASILAELAAKLSEAKPLPDEAFSNTFGQLMKATEATDTDKKGRALEHLAARLCWKLGLQNIEIRKLSDYEIDVRAEGRQPVFQKWVLQCKATQAPLGPAPVLREYGIAKLENIPVIVFVTTSGISDRARAVADQIMRQSNKVVILFDAAELKAMAEDEKAIYGSLQRQSDHARQIKIPQREAEVVSELVGETEDTSPPKASPLKLGRRPGKVREVKVSAPKLGKVTEIALKAPKPGKMIKVKAPKLGKMTEITLEPPVPTTEGPNVEKGEV